MALLVCEGFDYEQNSIGTDFGAGVGQNAPGFNGWTGQNCLRVVGLLGGFAYDTPNQASSINWNTTSPTAGPYIIGFRFNVTIGGASGPYYVITLFDSANGTQCGLNINTSTLQFFFWRGSPSTVVATGTTVLFQSAWFTVELQFSISTTTGAVKLIINGNQASPDINVTNVNTQATGNANVQKFWFGGNGGSNPTEFFDDLYILDTTGPAPLNNFLSGTGVGVWRIESLFPVSNNSVTFTPLAASNWNEVSETTSDNDTTYNSINTSGIDTFNHGALSSTPATIYAVSLVSKMRKDDTVNITVRNKLISGVTTANGTTYPINTVYQYIQDHFPTDPNTGLAWTGAAVNACKIGYERI